MINKKKDLIVIGGGAGGLNIASAASQLGLDVVLIESHTQLGGDCLHVGCVPSKTLIHSAKVAATMRKADQCGLESVEPHINLSRVNQHVKNVIDSIQVHDDPQRFRDYGCEVIFGQAKFVDSHSVVVNQQTIQGKRIIIATGSRAMIPPIDGLKDIDYLSNETIFELQQLPASMTVLGGGAIGVEIAQAYARLGCQVTIVEMFPQLLASLDSDIAELAKQALENEGVTIHTGTQVQKVSMDGQQKIIHCVGEQQQELTLSSEAILVATGRQPNIHDLNLAAANVTYSPRGIVVDQRLRSSQKHIFAVGDVVDSPYKFTHMAEYHAGIVIANVVFKVPKKVNYRVVPAVVFCDPEVASVGLTEGQAKQAGLKYTVSTFDFKNVDRAITDLDTHGLCKILILNNKILGAQIVGPHAGEVISEFVLAMQANVKISKISAAIHAYPTLAQIARRSVNAHYGKKLFSTKTKKIVRILNKILP